MIIDYNSTSQIMLSQFDKAYSLDIFEDITANPPSIPVLTNTVFNFEYVYSTMFGSQTPQELFGATYYNFEKAIAISKEIATLNPNQYTDIHQFDKPYERSRVTYLSCQGYLEFNNLLRTYLDSHKPHCQCVIEGYLSKLTHNLGVINQNELHETIAFITTLRQPSQYHNSDIICGMRNASYYKLQFMNYFIRNASYPQFMKQYTDNFDTYVAKHESELSEHTSMINNLTFRVEQNTQQYPECNEVRKIIQLMVETTSNVFAVMRNKYWCTHPDSDESNIAYIIQAYDVLYSRTHNEGCHPHDTFGPNPPDNLNNEMISVMNDVSLLPAATWKEGYQYVEEIKRRDEECRKFNIDKYNLRDAVNVMKFKYELYRGKHSIVDLYVKQTTLTHHASLLKDLVAKSLPPTAEDKLEIAIRERDEARSQVTDLQNQLDELRRQLADDNVLQFELDRERETSASLRSRLEAERQNTINMHRAYDEEHAKNETLRDKLAEIQSILVHWAELTSQ